MLMTMPLRRIFSSLAASAVLCSLTTQANAEFNLTDPAFPNHCVRFDTLQTRNKYPYDIALFQILARLNAYSGWREIHTLTKSTIPIEGLCVDTDDNAAIPFGLDQKTRSVSLRISVSGSKDRIDPQAWAVMIHADKYPVTGMIAGSLMALASQYNGHLIMDNNESMIEHIVLMTAIRSTIISEQILFGTEMANRHGQMGDIEFSIRRFPQLENEIFTLMMQSGVAEAQRQRVAEEDKTAFRQAVYTALLKDATLRSDIIKAWAKEHYQGMDERAQQGLPVKAPDNRRFDLTDLQEKLGRFPGRLGETPFLRTEYDHHWQARATEDVASYMQQLLQIKSDTVNATIRKNRAANDLSPD